ncbi:MBL fold metallo-hydrolase [Modestobacter lapidis]|nr:MBL fold metallo-hydrolase [Modestobacter lapidis]
MTGWREVGDQVYVRRHTDLDLNCGLVVGTSGCLVVDTGAHLGQGQDLADAVRAVTPRPWTVVNTHAHYDHCFGNAAFRPAAVWGARGCAASLRADGEQQRRTVAAELRAAGDPGADRVAAAPIDPPDSLVDAVTLLDVGGRTVTLTHPGRGHTDGDLVVAVDDVLFAGDLVEEGAPPAMEDAFPLEWPATLTAVLGQVRGTVVPGHGDVVGAAFVAGQRDELALLADWLTGRTAELPFDEPTRRTARSRL